MIRRVAVFFLLSLAQIQISEAQLQPEISSRRAGTAVMEHVVSQSLTGKGVLHQTKAPFTSAVVRISEQDNFEGALLLTGSDTFFLEEDIHYDGPGKNSQLIIFQEAVSVAKVVFPAASRSYSVFLISAPAISHNQQNLRRHRAAQEGCDEPEMVNQVEWRDGLAAPAYNRSFTETEHLIVHHSATSNNLTDYYNVVRNIYLYHTQVNGWSDIGYNYLIAADGTIFKGRDPGAGEQDLVLGAHFCGRNSTTMGVCVLGDYRFTEPTEESITALESLLTWKSYKDNLDVLAEKNHPLNSDLPVIAGHRQGCATECPGDQLYSRLDEVRAAVHTNLLVCSDELVVENLIVYPNPAYEELMIEVPEGAALESISIINLSGQVQGVKYSDEGLGGYKAFISDLAPGVYITRIKLRDQDPLFRKVIIL